jgi:hypothetical protein
MPEPGPACPFCKDPRVELISLFGSQLLLSQYRCSGCGSYFEGVRPEAEEPVTTNGEASRDGSRTE